MEKLHGKRLVGSLRKRWGNNIKMNLWEMGCEGSR
jgi:hypothetical protein